MTNNCYSPLENFARRNNLQQFTRLSMFPFFDRLTPSNHAMSLQEATRLQDPGEIV